MEHGPRATVTQLDRGEVDYVEVDVVLAHELVQTNVLVIEPPLLPLGCVVCCDANIADASFELGPHY